MDFNQNDHITIDLDSASSAAPPPADSEEKEMIVIGSDNPKIIEWEELQQELARLWSLSSALNKAKEKKEELSERIEAIIKVREEYLRQSNELEDMREKLEARKLTLGNLSMYTKRTLEDVGSQREQLCTKTRMLLVAGKTLSAAHQQLQEANKLLTGKRGHGNLKKLQKMLRSRQQYMITQVSTLYPVKALHESKEKIDSRRGSNKSRDSAGSSLPNMSKPEQVSPLTISGLQLTAIPLKKMSFFSNKMDIQRSATVLGYIAHAVFLIASYLDVPLRYPLRLGGSRSYILDHGSSVESASSDLMAHSIIGVNTKSTEFPLFLEGQDATRAAYALFLLNKDLEQLLNYIGAESLGPRHCLANLKELTRIIQSQEYIDG
ncbi:uncharacterized protein A4U43_C02F17190 [Asparagus officinalis]|uniref:UV radiation resistance-associated gene protein n=1 Tax=Asparagus officinalis TaxID=4686 RepID=A0A5P1FLM9_ASPOF|nr:UV radiation resistance-associated gene protein isoform X2 [Asparagus officinalis]ONK78317.1 uncharacterized protein A4U43_C02F17190 [Asparagus officinalis]